MRRAHWWVGTIALVVFLGTGAYMRWIHTPPVEELGDTTRAVFRSRHLFIMLSALANLTFAGNVRPGLVERVISALLLVAPVFLIAAFFTEPQHGIHYAPWAHAGLYILFGAAALLVIRRYRER